MQEELQNLQNFKTSSEKNKYFCKYCNYYTSRKSSIDSHNMSKRHILNKIQNSVNQNYAINHSFQCKNCDKIYKNRNGLWYHSKSCNNLNEISKNNVIVTSLSSSDNENTLNTNFIIEILKQNQELQKQIIEIVKDGKTINNTINNNQSFNMNVFLNEQCKDALNIGEFVNSLPLTLEDLENTGKVGYVKGITDIVLRALKEMDIHKRPIHCSDLKREVIYVKDNDVWHKDEENIKIKKAIQNIATRNYKQVKEWIEKYPEAKDITTKKHEQYVGIRLKCTGGSDIAEDEKLHSKILSNIAKVIHINK